MDNIDRLICKEICKFNTCIVHILDVSTDPSNSRSPLVLSQIDPEGSKHITVFTKLEGSKHITVFTKLDSRLIVERGILDSIKKQSDSGPTAYLSSTK
jgi:hypothetical protein